MADGLLNKASIILTPTGYKAGTLYNVAPVVEPYEDFDFARASVASRVNSSGLVEMVGRTLGSELVTNGDFATDSDWTKGTNTTIENGKAILPITSGGMQYISSNTANLISGNTYKITLTAQRTSGTGRLAFTDSSTNNISGTPLIDSDGDLVYYFIPTSNINGFGFKRHDVSGNYTWELDNVSVKEIIDTNNIPRISYDSNGDNGHILLEPTSTNLVTYSEDFSQWTLGSNATLTYESDVVAPDGSLGVYRLTLPATSSTFLLSNIFSGQNPLALSIYAKSAGTNNNFNLYDGSSSSSLKTATSEWQRFDYIGNGAQLAIINSGDTFITDIYIWGAQAEALSYATSYIPTLTGSTVTRATETATGAGSAELINSTEGVLYAEIAALADDGTYRFISLNDGTFDNAISIRFDNSSNTIKALLRLSSVNQALLSYSFSTIQFYKIAFKYKANDFALWINGVEVDTDTSGSTFSSNTLTRLDFYRGDNTNHFYGKCKALAVFNEALSDSELTQLTT